jgi:hypothetical protein
MKVVSIVLLFVLMCFISCDSFKNPEIQEIKAEVERQNREKEEIRGQAVKKAMELFQIEDKDGLEKFFYTHEVAVFKDKRTGVCLPMLFQKKSKEWKTFGLLKNSPLSAEYSSGTYGGDINFNNLKNLVKNYCMQENQREYDFQNSLVSSAQQYTGAMYLKGGRNNDGIALDELGLLLVSLSDVSKKPVDLTVRNLNEFKDKYSSGDGRFAKITKKGDIQKSALRTGDVVFYLMPYSNDQELKVNKSISKLRQYIWGAGIYNGKEKIIHASSYDENYSVLEEDFESFILRNKIDMIYHFSIKL